MESFFPMNLETEQLSIELVEPPLIPHRSSFSESLQYDDLFDYSSISCGELNADMTKLEITLS